ncbi:MAG: hypothetical protein RIR95_1979 [Pseudomonadota bacterium]|jgi:hypothetical protein
MRDNSTEQNYIIVVNRRHNDEVARQIVWMSLIETF